ncbi:MAG TPA: hypothetical protein VGQ18_12120 [Gemmatimonadales bacterium]|jgi:hypothetical protein|nr:hypothetical protein [Gemmatimonadales bacterium]
MKLAIADRAAVILFAAALYVAPAAPLAAQQVADSLPTSTSAAPATTPLAGPRLQPEWTRFEPRVADTPASLAATHTIRVSTLVLVLSVVILVLLIA